MRSFQVLLLLAAAATSAAENAFFESDGVRLHYFVEGSGETVVLLHGFSGSAEGLYVKPGTLSALVEAGYRAVALDQVGHGQSEKPYDTARYGLNMVEDVRRLLDHLDVEKAHVVGYSMGSKVANSFRDIYPERLNSITLGGYGWPWQSQQTTYAEAKRRLTSRSILPGNDLDALAAVSMSLYELAPGEDSLRSNEIPAFGIIGDQDTVVPTEDWQKFRDTMHKLRVVVMPGTHAGPDGAPYKKQYADELVKFLGTVQ